MHEPVKFDYTVKTLHLLFARQGKKVFSIFQRVNTLREICVKGKREILLREASYGRHRTTRLSLAGIIRYLLQCVSGIQLS
jgi:hypothetical protein